MALFDVLQEHRAGEQIVHRDIEKSLQLRRMQVHGEHAVRTSSIDEIRRQLS
jgi:hypothetical protein